jgi:hypothetical protein
MPQHRTRPSVNQRGLYIQAVVAVLADGPLETGVFYERAEEKAKRLIGTDFIIRTVSKGAIGSLQESGDVLVNLSDRTQRLNPDLPEYNPSGYASDMFQNDAKSFTISDPSKPLPNNVLVITLNAPRFGNRGDVKVADVLIHTFQCAMRANLLERALLADRPHPFVLFDGNAIHDDAAKALAKRLRGLALFYDQPPDVQTLVAQAHLAIQPVGDMALAVATLKGSLAKFGF